ANRRVLVSLQRTRGGDIVVVPDGVMGTAAHFFDYEAASPRGLRARFRVRTVTGCDPAGQAFLGLIGAHAALFVPSGKRDAAAWKEAQKHFATYGDMLVVVASSRPVRGVDGVV